MAEQKGLAPIPIENVLKVPVMDGLSAQTCADIFLKSEEFYVERTLRVVSETFEFRLKNHIAVRRPILESAEIQQVFLNITNIYEFNRKLYQELLSLRLDQKLLEGLGAVMTTHIPFFKLYTSYIKLYRKSLKFLDVLVDKKRSFREFLEINEMCARLPLKTLLLAPVARMPQYLMFMGSIYRAMDASSPAANNLAAAIRAVQTATDDIAFSLRDQVARKLVVTVQQKIFQNSCDLVSPHRYVIKHGDLKKVYNKAMRHIANKKVYLFILFNDMLLYGLRPGKLSSGKVKHTLQLRGLSVTDVPNAERVKNAFKITSNTKSFVLCAPNAETKMSWMQSIKEQVDIHNRSESSLQKSALSGDAFERIIKKKATKQDLELLRQQQQVRIKPLGNGGVMLGAGGGGAQSTFRSAGPPPGNPPGYGAGGAGAGGMPSPPPGNPPPPAGNPPPPSGNPPGVSPYPPSGPSPFPPSGPAPSTGGYAPPPPMSSYNSYSNGTSNGYQTSSGSFSEPGQDNNYDSYSTTSQSSSGSMSYSQPQSSPSSSYRPAPPMPQSPPSASPTMGFRPPPPAAPTPPASTGYSSAASTFAPPPAPMPPSASMYAPPPMAPAFSAPAPPQAPQAPMISPAAPEAPPLTFDYSSSPSVSQNLLSAISSNKSSKPGEWQEVLDPASGEYYYENTVTGESTWERPAEFDSAAASIWGGNEQLASAATEMDLQDTLVKSLNRYRQFVQDEEDDVQQQDTPDDEWD